MCGCCGNFRYLSVGAGSVQSIGSETVWCHKSGSGKARHEAQEGALRMLIALNDGELHDLEELTESQALQALADFRDELRRPVNSSHAAYLGDVIAELNDQIAYLGEMSVAEILPLAA